MAQTQTRAVHALLAQCTVCVAAFKSSVALQAHAVYSHRVGFHMCAWCKELIGNESKILQHAKSCPEVANREEADIEAFCIVGNHCNICESSFPSHERAIEHYKEVHLHCIYICGVCVKYFHKKEKFDSHLADVHPEEGQPSNLVATQMKKPIISERSFIDKYNLTREFNEKRCIDCKISFASIAKISEHFRTEHQFEMHVCMKCEKGYTLKHSLDKHPCRPQKLSDYSRVYKHKLMKAFHEKRCLDCHLDFASVTEVTEHFNANHCDVNVCKRCGKGFMARSALYTHVCDKPVRNDSVPHSKRLKMLKEFRDKRCSTCDFTFTSNLEGVDHFLTEHRFKILECKKCDLVTSSGFRLKYHPCLKPQQPRLIKGHRQSLKTFIKKKRRNAPMKFERNAKGTNNHRRLAKSLLENGSINNSHDRDLSGSTSLSETSMDCSNNRKHPCCLCPYDLPTYEMGLNHYAEAHDVFIFECPAPHCFQLFRRFSKWSRHFLKSHPDVELPVNSEFRTLLDDIMEQAYNKVLAESLISVPAEKINSATQFEQKVQDQPLENMCSTPISSNEANRGETTERPMTHPETELSVHTFVLNDTDTETDKKATADSDVEIVEWIPGTDVKPVIKVENIIVI